MNDPDEHLQKPMQYEDRVELEQASAARYRAINSQEREKQLELLEAMPRRERQKRLEVLEARLPQVASGYGIDRKLRPIRADEARTHSEFQDALDYTTILVLNSKERNKGRSRTQSLLQSIHSDFRAAVSWARHTFHAHGFPSSCYVRYSKETKAWTVATGVQYRQSDDHGPQGVMPISKAIYSDYFPELEKGSPLYFAADILWQFRLIKQSWSRIISFQKWSIIKEELLERQRLAVSQGDTKKVFALAELLAEAELIEVSGDFSVFLCLVSDLNKMLCAHKEALIRAETELEALAKRNQTRVNRENAAKAGQVNARLAEERKTHWFAYLNERASSKSWMLQRDAAQLTSAIRGFKKRLKDNGELAGLFRRVGKDWYEERLEEWRQQSIEIAVNSER